MLRPEPGAAQDNETTTPARRRLHSASAPKMPAVTSPSMRTVPSSAGASASKPPSLTCPQAARPGPPPSPSRARWNAIPSSSSRPDAAYAGEVPDAVRSERPRPEPGQPSRSGSGASGVPSNRATESIVRPPYPARTHARGPHFMRHEDAQAALTLNVGARRPHGCASLHARRGVPVLRRRLRRLPARVPFLLGLYRFGGKMCDSTTTSDKAGVIRNVTSSTSGKRDRAQ